MEDVTLRVTKLRSTEGEMFTIPNGPDRQVGEPVARTGRARSIDIPVPASANLNQVNEVLHGVAEKAMEDRELRDAAAWTRPS